MPTQQYVRVLLYTGTPEWIERSIAGRAIKDEYRVAFGSIKETFSAMVMDEPVVTEAEKLLKQIADALGTGETGTNLVAVARSAHRTEIDYARSIKTIEALRFELDAVRDAYTELQIKIAKSGK